MRVPVTLSLGLSLTLSLILTGTLTAQDGWKDLKGDWVPELKAKAWLNTPDEMAPTTTSMKGKVWLLMFFMATRGDCLEKVVEVSKLHDKHFKAGFRVLAISNEPLRDLKENVVQKHKATCWIGSDFSNETFKGFLVKEAFAIPKFFLVDVEGRVVAVDIPSDRLLKKLGI